MKKTVFLLAVGSILLLSSCETTKEIFLDKDGSGSYTTTSDMSSILGIAKMSIPADKMDSIGIERAVDTTVALEKLADLLENLTEQERNKVKGGQLSFTLDMKNEKFITKMTFPFASASEISDLDKLSSKVIQQFLKKQMNEKKKPGEIPMSDMGAIAGLGDKLDEGVPNANIDEYYTIGSSSGLFERKLNSERYNAMGAEEKEGRKQMAGMGMGNSKIIINLPGPVTKTEGKNITVSDDKKKITIESSAEDFLDNPKDMEFRIEY